MSNIHHCRFPAVATAALIALASQMSTQAFAQSRPSQGPVFVDKRPLPARAEAAPKAKTDALRERLAAALKALKRAQTEKSEALAALEQQSVEAKALLAEADAEHKRLEAELATKDKVLASQLELTAKATSQAEAAEKAAQDVQAELTNISARLSNTIQAAKASEEAIQKKLQRTEQALADMKDRAIEAEKKLLSAGKDLRAGEQGLKNQIAQLQNKLTIEQAESKAEIRRLSLELQKQREIHRTAEKLARVKQERLSAELTALRIADIERQRQLLKNEPRSANSQ